MCTNIFKGEIIYSKINTHYLHMNPGPRKDTHTCWDLAANLPLLSAVQSLLYPCPGLWTNLLCSHEPSIRMKMITGTWILTRFLRANL